MTTEDFMVAMDVLSDGDSPETLAWAWEVYTACEGNPCRAELQRTLLKKKSYQEQLSHSKAASKSLSRSLSWAGDGARAWSGHRWFSL
jgi:hypothetical protein